MRAGAQLYTVRDFCLTLPDFAETLKRVASMGYKTVQVSGTCPYDAEWLKNELAKNGLECVITHIPPARLVNETEKVASEHAVFGTRYVGLGYYSFTDEASYDSFVKTYGRVADELKKNDKYFMYHNHLSELGRVGNDQVLRRLSHDFAPDVMGFTLDTYWIKAAGNDPVSWIKELSGRVPCVHLKDYGDGGRMEALGEGSIDFEKVLAASSDAGTGYLLVEQDDCGGRDPFACLEKSLAYLHSLGIE